MFDIGFQELVLIAVLALVVLGPKRLPEAARTAGRWLGRLRAFIANVKQDLDREMNLGELQELRRLREELDETRRVIEQTSGKTMEQLQAMDHAILDDSAMTFRDDEPARSRAIAAPGKKKTARKKTSAPRPASKKAANKPVKKPAARKKKETK